MRLHHLEMEAFGPFADPVTVDFDALSEASLFLLCGDTGAGKTTVLDGVCFALYGDVPGRRGTAKQLRSHHAAPGQAPRVVLEVTVAGRRLRFTRSPAWQRPKKRGTGTTTEQARVLVEEQIGGPDGDWVLRTNRLDEAGHLVDDLLGMTLSQFSQVVLLPQGQFDTFLRASAEERQRVLTKLFDTGRFEQVERWFAERRKQLWRDNRRHQASVAEVLHRLSECADAHFPEQWDPEDLAVPVADGELQVWAGGLLERAEAEVARTARVLEQTGTSRRLAAAALDDGRRLDELHARRRRALAQLHELESGRVQAERDLDRLAAARRAAAVAPLDGLVTDAAHRRDRASARRARTLTELVRATRQANADDPELETDDLDHDALKARERQTLERLAAARAFLPRAEELRVAERDQERTLREAEEIAAALASDEAELVDLPERRRVLDDRIAKARADAARVPVLNSTVERLAVRLEAAEHVVRLESELRAARQAAEQQRVVVADLKERWMDLRERRLEGMAAELAVAMRVGAGCPVCGSVDHPAPARPAPGAPTREEEQAALDDREDAELVLEARRDQVRGLEARLAAVRETAGAEPLAELRGLLVAAERDLSVATEAQDRQSSLTEELDFLDERVARVTAHAADLRARQAAVQERAAQLEGTVARLTAELSGLLGDAAERLEDLIAGHERLEHALASARAALEEEARCVSEQAAAQRRLQEAALEAGFDDAEEALGALVGGQELRSLEQECRARELRERQAAEVLADPAVEALEGVDPPDLAALQSAYEAAEAAADSATTAARVAERTLAQLRSRHAQLVDALDEWGPARAEYARVRALAELVEGKGADNTRQMRLSAYVLSARLTQVVAAANERLARMVDHRYLLEHTADRGAGDRRGGLGLLVRDQWTDELRDPVTLSGGETFVVSLALALGLADVVTAESGATDIDTLFVDEGFGSLDAETLELVMDTLDQLREGGRTVGVVSHVAEMRSRIPTRLEVQKGRAGSTLRLLNGTY